MTDSILLEGKSENIGIHQASCQISEKKMNVKLSQHNLCEYDFNNAAKVIESFRFHFRKTHFPFIFLTENNVNLC